MYLSNLTDEEKSAFFSLAKCIIDADNKVAENEETLLSQFLQEMSMDISQIIPLSLEGAIDVFCESGFPTRKQVYIELFGLVMCDSDFAEEEKSLLSHIADKLGLSAQIQEDIQKCVMDLLGVYDRMNKIVLETAG